MYIRDLDREPRSDFRQISHYLRKSWKLRRDSTVTTRHKLSATVDMFICFKQNDLSVVTPYLDGAARSGG